METNQNHHSHEAGDAGLTKFARLDTTVTVIDAFTMHNDFHTADLLADRRKDVTPEDDERTVSDLMVDQIEFADVIVLNKTDAVTPEALAGVKDLVRALNREAKILCASYGKVDVGELVNTKLFNLEKAQTGAGWMQDLHELLIREVRLLAGEDKRRRMILLTTYFNFSRSTGKMSLLLSQRRRSTMCAISSTSDGGLSILSDCGGWCTTSSFSSLSTQMMKTKTMIMIMTTATVMVVSSKPQRETASKS